MKFYFNDLAFVDKIDNDCYFEIGNEIELINRNNLIARLAEEITNNMHNFEIIVNWDEDPIFTFCKTQEEYDQLNLQYTLFLLQKD
jgi:hypothetical protein